MCDKKSRAPCINCGTCIDYRSKRCYSCYKQYLADTKPARDLKQKEYRKQWYKDNKKKVVAQGKKRAASLSKSTRKGYTLKSKYNITIEDYNNLLERCDFKCQICQKPHTDTNVLAVDHCHTTKKIRGLLCRSCNTALGHFKDDVSLLKIAIKYLKK